MIYLNNDNIYSAVYFVLDWDCPIFNRLNEWVNDSPVSSLSRETKYESLEWDSTLLMWFQLFSFAWYGRRILFLKNSFLKTIDNRPMICKYYNIENGNKIIVIQIDTNHHHFIKWFGYFFSYSKSYKGVVCTRWTIPLAIAIGDRRFSVGNWENHIIQFSRSIRNG